MFGVYVDTAPHHYETIVQVVKAAVHYTHWPTLLMGMFAFAVMYGLKWLSPRIPNVLVAVVITTSISWATGFQHDQNVSIEAIESPARHNLIEQFNRPPCSGAVTCRRANPISVKRSTTLNSSHNDIGVLDAEHMWMCQPEYLTPAGGSPRLPGTNQSNPAGRCSPGRWRPLNFIQKIKSRRHGKRRAHMAHQGRQRTPGHRQPQDDGRRGRGRRNPQGLPSLTYRRSTSASCCICYLLQRLSRCWVSWKRFPSPRPWPVKPDSASIPTRNSSVRGLGNICGAIGKSYPTSGSFSRSAVNLQARAVTGLSSVFTSLAVVIVLLFFTPLLYHLPQSVLAAVIMMAVIGLLNVSGFIHAWKAKWYDGAISIISFVSTMVFAPHLDKGIMIGVVLSLMVFLYKSMRPRWLFCPGRRTRSCAVWRPMGFRNVLM
jgi:SulP family sulfate permease